MWPFASKTEVAAVMEIPKPQLVKPAPSDERKEFAAYVEQCKRIHAGHPTYEEYIPPVVQAEQLRYYLADKAIPSYDHREVHEHLLRLARSRHRFFYGYTWVGLRVKDGGLNDGEPFIWPWWNNRCTFSRHTTYDKMVPASVLSTVETISEAFPDARFYISAIHKIKDPFLIATIRGEEPMIVDFWNEPGFRPTRLGG